MFLSLLENTGRWWDAKIFQISHPPLSPIVLDNHQVRIFSLLTSLPPICYLSCTYICLPCTLSCLQLSDLKYSAPFSVKVARFLVEKTWPLCIHLRINVSLISQLEARICPWYEPVLCLSRFSWGKTLEVMCTEEKRVCFRHRQTCPGMYFQHLLGFFPPAKSFSLFSHEIEVILLPLPKIVFKWDYMFMISLGPWHLVGAQYTLRITMNSNNHYKFII